MGERGELGEDKRKEKVRLESEVDKKRMGEIERKEEMGEKVEKVVRKKRRKN